MTDLLPPPPTRPAAARPLPAAAGEAPLLGTVGVLLRHVRLVVGVPLFTTALAVGTLLWLRDWSATSRITPQLKDENLQGIAGVAAQFGVNLPAGQTNESVDFYADLLKSRELLDSLALTHYRFPIGSEERDTLSGTYIDLYGITGKTDYDRLYKARRKLDRKIAVTVKRTAGLVTVETNAKWGRLAEQMNRRLLDLVNQFNLHRRQTTARAEREFLEGRLAAVSRDVEAAQAAQRAFLERNRVWQSDPALAAQGQSLARRVEEGQQTYDDLLRRYEQARVEEVRNTPVITIVESPEGSRKRSGGLVLTAVLGIVAGLILATALALALDYAERERALHPETYDAVRRLWRSLPERLLGRMRRERGTGVGER